MDSGGRRQSWTAWEIAWQLQDSNRWFQTRCLNATANGIQQNATIYGQPLVAGLAVTAQQLVIVGRAAGCIPTLLLYCLTGWLAARRHGTELSLLTSEVLAGNGCDG